MVPDCPKFLGPPSLPHKSPDLAAQTDVGDQKGSVLAVFDLISEPVSVHRTAAYVPLLYDAYCWSPYDILIFARSFVSRV